MQCTNVATTSRPRHCGGQHTAILKNMREIEDQNVLYSLHKFFHSHALTCTAVMAPQNQASQFTQLLRKPFAIPCLLPLDDEYSCSCGGRTVQAKLSTDPFHALHCKAHGKAWRTKVRHNRLARDLARCWRRCLS